ncbi:hypothetical protein U6K69_10965, partial [Cutibacterium acnes]
IGGEYVGGQGEGVERLGSPPHRRGIHQPTTTDAGAVTRYECTRSNVSKLCGAAQLNSTLAGVLRSDLDCLASA